VPARSHSVGGFLSPSRAICPQIQIGKPTLPEHGAIASQAGDGDCERLLQTSKTGEGHAPVRPAELEPGDGGIAAVPADDLPGERVGLGRPGDSQLITSRPNNAEGIPTRACGTPLGGAASPWMPVTTGCWLTAHADASDPSDDPSPRELARPARSRPRAAIPTLGRTADNEANERLLASTRLAIESVFANLKGQMRPEQHLAKTPGGLALRIAQRLLALTLGILLNTLHGRRPRALAAYDGR